VNVKLHIALDIILHTINMRPILYILLCLTPDYFTLSNARQVYSSRGSIKSVLALNGLIRISAHVLVNPLIN
jgi:hypothetical protein